MAREQRFVFDEVADTYDRVRPGYPEALVRDVVALCGLSSASRVLEVGCGSGQATRAFAPLDFEMVCLEPGRRLAALAAARCAPWPSVRVETVAFEDWPLERGSFALVLSAQAFHWIDPRVRFAKAAAALRPDGSLAIVANRPVVRESPLRRELDQAYARFAPTLTARLPATGSAARSDPRDDIEASGLFGKVTTREYAWSREYSARDYADLMRTQSDHRLLEAASLDTLLGAIAAVVERRGGSIETEWVASVWVARRL
jgi:SAM-dependent methyltransferase